MTQKMYTVFNNTMSQLLNILKGSRLIPSLEFSAESLHDCFPNRYFCKYHQLNKEKLKLLYILYYQVSDQIIRGKKTIEDN